LVGIIGYQPNTCPADDRIPSRHINVLNYICWIEKETDGEVDIAPLGMCLGGRPIKPCSFEEDLEKFKRKMDKRRKVLKARKVRKNKVTYKKPY
jgi:hypothetical protein